MCIRDRVITKFVQALIEFGDEVLYPNPGYPIYESQIEFIGGKPLAYRYLPTATGFEIDLDQIRSLITPATKAIVYNNLQNPISAESTPVSYTHLDVYKRQRSQ